MGSGLNRLIITHEYNRIHMATTTTCDTIRALNRVSHSVHSLSLIMMCICQAFYIVFGGSDALLIVVVSLSQVLTC